MSEKKLLQKRNWERGERIRTIIANPQFKQTFITPREVLGEMIGTGKSAKEVIGDRFLVEGYSFVADYVDDL